MLKKIVILGVLVVFFAVACGKQEGEKRVVEEKGTVDTAGQSRSLPEGHPSVDKGMNMRSAAAQHSGIKSTKAKEIRLSDEVKAKWKEVEIEVTDSESDAKDVIKVKVGVDSPIGDTGFSVKVSAFVPDYTMFEDYVSTRSDEPNNPAVFVELLKGDEVVASGWVFKKLPTFNSYKHDRFTVALLTPLAAEK